MTELDVTALLLYEWKDEQEKGLWLGCPERPWWKRLATWLTRQEDIFIYVTGLFGPPVSDKPACLDCGKDGQILISASSVWLHVFGESLPLKQYTVSDLDFVWFVKMFYTIVAHETFHSEMYGEGLSGYQEELILQQMGLESSLSVFDWNTLEDVLLT